jgi:hypothetical protein
MRIGAWLVGIFLLLSGCVAGWLALQRYRVEERNKAIEIVLDYSEVASLAAAGGQPLEEFLKQLPVSCSIALTEGSLDDWGSLYPTPDGMVCRMDPERFRQAKAVLALKARVELDRPSRKPYILVAVEGLPERDEKQSTGDLKKALFYVPGDPQVIRKIGLGLDPQSVEIVQRAGLHPLARLENFPGANQMNIRALLQRVHLQGVRAVIFSGDQVLGFRNTLETTEQAFRTFQLLYGSIEFGKQAGDLTLTSRLWDKTVRVHSVSAPEVIMMPASELLDRYARAAQERNIRVLYVRLPMGASQPAHELAFTFLKQLQSTLYRQGNMIKPAGARPFEPLQPLVWSSVLVGLGVGSLAGWLLSRFWNRLPAWLPIVLLAGVCGVLCLSLTGRKMVALLAAVLFPTVAFITLPQRHTDRMAWGTLLSLLLRVFGWSLLGALHVVGLLAESKFLVKADQFTGIKLAHVLPMLAVGLFYAWMVAQNWQTWREWLMKPVFWWQAGLALVLLAAVALMVLRTGNEAPGAVSEIELRIRSLLERVLSVRPRTKEFLIGHPALVIALSLLLMGRRNWLPIWMMLAAIGQISLVNTFCHLHSPLMVSLLRTGWSMLFGLGIGFALLAIKHRIVSLHKANTVSTP